MTPQETDILVALVRSASPKVMIEFGVNQGITACRLLENVPGLEKYIGIDVPRTHQTTLGCQRNEVPDNPGEFAAHDERFSLLLAPSQTLMPDDLEPADAVFIDGDHAMAAVLHESQLARSLLRPGGIIVWHDWLNPAVEVTEALFRLRVQGWQIDDVENSWLAFTRV